MEHEYEITVQGSSPRRFLEATVFAAKKYDAEVAEEGTPRLTKPYRLRLEFRSKDIIKEYADVLRGYSLRCVKQFYTKPELNKMRIGEIQQVGRVWGVTGREIFEMATSIFEAQAAYLKQRDAVKVVSVDLNKAVKDVVDANTKGVVKEGSQALIKTPTQEATVAAATVAATQATPVATPAKESTLKQADELKPAFASFEEADAQVKKPSKKQSKSK